MRHLRLKIEKIEKLRDVLSREEIFSLFREFFTGKFERVCLIFEDKKPDRRGCCRMSGDSCTISIDVDTIEEHLMMGIKMGGTRCPSDLREAVASVLVHEIRHASQDVIRLSEADARDFVDKNIDKISSLLSMSHAVGCGQGVPVRVRDRHPVGDVLFCDDEGKEVDGGGSECADGVAISSRNTGDSERF